MQRRGPVSGRIAAPDVERVELDVLCGQSDYISLHSPLTPGTRKLIDARRLALIKPNTIVVNTARLPHRLRYRLDFGKAGKL
ncbi:NAD(P)-dependent oxidoreductase [Paraburkholderia azotifigens]|uniref:NAD(P)-dependent oxidoreductase n=1 Tax=Paraburkholderia azotifigens TaxID=2057004 RepID=A0A5C6VGW6_9BURK|nr:NAD(P)-dependent oxidoreductase [Paraburkholderia azotifigens]TXC84139.1 hypothetical protein FRZ40_27955 [Paraburkholderia azotifigens]